MNFHKSFFLLLILPLASAPIGAQCLSGTYTIGGNNPSYATITAAVAALNANGVCGPVTFNIRDGVYNENVRIRQYPGASAANRVTFQSESGDSTHVEWRDLNYQTVLTPILLLDSADYVTVQKLTFRNVCTYDLSCVVLRNGATYDYIRNCVLVSQVPQANYQSANYWIYYSLIGIQNSVGTLLNEFNEFSRNHFFYGDFGIYFGNTTSGYETANKVLFNTFEKQSHLGVEGSNQRKMVITGNTFFSDMPGTIPNYNKGGIYLSGAKDSITISQNRIERISGTDGITLYLASPGTARVFNNFVRLTTDPNGTRCLRVQGNGSGTLLLAYNTMRITGANTFYNVAELYPTGAVTCRNNQFIHEGNGLALYYSGTAALYTGTNNDLYSANGTNLVYFNANYATLAAYQTGTGKDANSLSVKPYFTHVHTYRFNSKLLDSAGVIIPSITTDIEGNARNTVKPDIGAWEFAPRKLDAGISYIVPAAYNCGGTSPVLVTLRNFGTDTLTSAQIGWTVNGTPQTPFSYSGTILHGDSVTSINIGSFTSSGPTTIKVFPQLVNGQADADPVNDTTASDHRVGALNGVYTIGPWGCDYATFTAAKAALAANGICGSVVFKVRQGFYREKVAFPNITGSSAINTIRFESADGLRDFETLTSFSGNSTYNYTLQLSGTRFITFYDITIETYANDLNFTQYDTNPIQVLNTRRVTFDSCRIKGLKADPFSGSNTACLFTLGIDSIHIVNNYMTGGSYSFYGTSSSGLAGDFKMLKNKMLDNYDGIYINGLNKAVMDSNEVAGYTQYGYGTGVAIVGMKGFLFRKNNVRTYDQALRIANTRPMGGVRPEISNNFLYGGLYVSFATSTDVLFNSVFIDTAVASQNSNNHPALDMQQDSGIVVLNNILSDKRPSVSVSCVRFYATNGYPQFAQSNYNDFNSTVANCVCNSQNFTYYTLPQWTNATGFDAATVNIDPPFLASSDLHLVTAALGGLATPLVSVTTDIDGALRPGAPTIGADEQNLFLVNAALPAPIGEVNVFPNPSSGKFTVTGKGFIQVYNLLGKEVYAGRSDSGKLEIDLGGHAAGIYLVRIYSGQDHWEKKVVVQ